jgi:hypothetical protein
MQHHRMSFFGQKTGVLFDSGDWSDQCVYIRFLKKKDNGTWEKPSAKEGRSIKINLMEIIAILDIFDNDNKKWSTVHRFRNENTPITFDKKNDGLSVSIPSYSKYFRFPESKLFEKLLQHIFEEKIQYSTGHNPGSSQKNTEIPKSSLNSSPRSNLSNSEYVNSGSKFQPPMEKKISNFKNFSESAPKISRDHDYGQKFQDDYEPMDVNLFEIESQQSSLMDEPNSSEGKNFNALGSKEISNPQDWFRELQVREDYCLVPGEIIAKSSKAIAFQISHHNSTWVPRSLIDGVEDYNRLHGLWIKRWFIEKKIQDIFA